MSGKVQKVREETRKLKKKFEEFVMPGARKQQIFLKSGESCRGLFIKCGSKEILVKSETSRENFWTFASLIKEE